MPDGKLEFNSRLGLTGVDQVIIAIGPGLTPESPGNGIDQGGLAVPVVAADAGSMNAGEIDRRNIIPVTHKITQGQFNRNHFYFQQE
jgi:hypothetical protein